MNHTKWVRGELKELSRSLGFRYTPREGAVGIENTVVVTADGCEILTPLEQDIFVV